MASAAVITVVATAALGAVSVVIAQDPAGEEVQMGVQPASETIETVTDPLGIKGAFTFIDVAGSLAGVDISGVDVSTLLGLLTGGGSTFAIPMPDPSEFFSGPGAEGSYVFHQLPGTLGDLFAALAEAMSGPFGGFLPSLPALEPAMIIGGLDPWRDARQRLDDSLGLLTRQRPGWNGMRPEGGSKHAHLQPVRGLGDEPEQAQLGGRFEPAPRLDFDGGGAQASRRHESDSCRTHQVVIRGISRCRDRPQDATAGVPLASAACRDLVAPITGMDQVRVGPPVRVCEAHPRHR